MVAQTNPARGYAWAGMLLLPAVVALLDTPGLRRSTILETPQRMAVAHHLPRFQPVGDAWDIERVYSHLAIRDALMLRESPTAESEWYLVERTGRIVALSQDPAGRALQVVIDLSKRLGTPLDHEQGVLGLAFHPAVADPESEHYRELFVAYAGSEADRYFWRLSKFREADDAGTTLNSEVVLIDQTDPHPWHNAGCLEFGPDGFLYAATGDGGGLNDQFQNSQRIDGGLFSGILRIDVDCGAGGGSHSPPRQPTRAVTKDYWIPDDNPFVGVAGANEEFWSIGYRNPFRMSFDAHTGELWVGDTGSLGAEEINIARRGSNHQWSYREGREAFPHSSWKGRSPPELIGVETKPRYVYREEPAAHCTQQGYCVIGGLACRSTRYPELNGTYLFGDYGTGRVFSLPIEGPTEVEPVELLRISVSGEVRLASIATNRTGDVYLVVGPTAGPETAIYRLVRVDPSAPQLPDRLSETGLFDNLAAMTPAPGLLPYEINSPLWSSGVEKRRWMALPAGQIIQLESDDHWTFPAGTVLVKHFEVPSDDGQPAKPLETRVLVRDDRGGIYGATYRWDDDRRDAVLAASEGVTCAVSLGTRNGSRTEVPYRLPARDECLHCHNAHAGLILGVKASQLNRPLRVGDGESQLANWSRRGMFNRRLTRAELRVDRALISLADRTAPLERRVRSYLDVNCAHCHRPQSNIRAWFDLRYQTPLAKTGLLNGNVADALNIPGGRVVVPGDSERSLLYRRIAHHDPRYRMPPLAISIGDEVAIDDVSRWISQMPSDVSNPVATR